MAESREAIEAGDYERPLELARKALAAHAVLHGPAGKPELREEFLSSSIVAQATPPVHTNDESTGEGACGTIDFPGREDFVHDLLAKLAQRMMDLNETKHTEMDGFLTWLERHLGCPLDELSGKSLIRNYDDREKIADFDDLSRRLCSAANRRKIAGDPRSRDFQEAIQAEYEPSVQRLDEVNEALARTDELIDNIVYALYGLSEEEIAIVEESLA